MLELRLKRPHVERVLASNRFDGQHLSIKQSKRLEMQFSTRRVRDGVL